MRNISEKAVKPRIYGGQLCGCPLIDEIDKKYYYDSYLLQRQMSSTEHPEIERMMFSIVKERQPFEWLEMKKEDLLEKIKHNRFEVLLLK